MGDGGRDRAARQAKLGKVVADEREAPWTRPRNHRARGKLGLTRLSGDEHCSSSERASRLAIGQQDIVGRTRCLVTLVSRYIVLLDLHIC